MKVFRPIVFFLLIGISFPLRAGNGFCDVRNTAFLEGESITLKVFYTVVGAYFGAGEATFTNVLEKFNGKPVYRVTECVQDVLSAVYYSRNIDFNKYKAGDKIAFSMFLDNEIYEMYIRYLGKETIKTKYGKFRAIKFKPLLIKGTIFEGGEKMVVYVSDDGNKIPLRIESPISVGSIKVDMMSYRNLRYPLSSLLGVR